MSDQHVEDQYPPEPVGLHSEVPDRVEAVTRPGAGKWRVGDADDGEGVDHFTELERRLIANLRGCQRWCARTEDQLGRLMYALGEVVSVLEEIRAEDRGRL